MIVTITCSDCDYTTDIDTLSDTNPTICPCAGCSGDLLIGETDEPLYGEDGEYSGVLYED